MKATYSAVAYGWTPHPATRAPMPWCAEILGPDPVYGYRRVFLPHAADHLEARGTGHGVVYWWILQPGRLYQCKSLTGKKGRWQTRWLTVTDDGEIVDLTREEADEWLRTSECSASTS